MKITFAASKPRNAALSRLVENERTAGLFAIPTGKRKDMTQRKLVLLPRRVIALAKERNVSRIAIQWRDFVFPHLDMSDQDLAETLAVNLLMANYEFTRYKTRPKEGGKEVKEVVTIANRVTPEMKQGLKRGTIIGQEVNACRDLANTRAADMTPTKLADAARQRVQGTEVKLEVLDRADMEKLNMGGILAVAKGSIEEPKLIIMEYQGERVENTAPPRSQPIVLIGKGVTFDSGGLNLKTGEWLPEMHLDMSGGGSIIHALTLAAKLNLPKHIIGLIPAVENMPSGSSYRPGDIIKTMSGKTVEILNTDAEGRIILADALTYAQQYRPCLIIDVATLTSASIIALGKRASALFTNDDRLETLVRELGEASGDYVWPLPLWEEYYEDIKGTYADLANAGRQPKFGGAIHGAIFLKQFVPRNTPWIHLDTAPRFISIEGEYLAKGATGAPVRLLIKLLESY